MESIVKNMTEQRKRERMKEIEAMLKSYHDNYRNADVAHYDRISRELRLIINSLEI
jgi:hypothetical protein